MASVEVLKHTAIGMPQPTTGPQKCDVLGPMGLFQKFWRIFIISYDNLETCTKQPVNAEINSQNDINCTQAYLKLTSSLEKKKDKNF